MGAIDHRIWRAVLACTVALLLLSSATGTWGRWHDVTEVGSSASITAGDLSLTSAPTRIELHSAQPAGSRDFVSTSTCQAPQDYQQWVVVSDTLPQEHLVSSDRLRIQQPFTLEASGNNLAGEFTLDASDVLGASSTAFSESAELTYSFSSPDSCAQPDPGVLVCAVAPPSQGLGTYEVTVDIATAATDDGTPWGDALTDQPLHLDQINARFVQDERDLEEGP